MFNQNSNNWSHKTTRNFRQSKRLSFVNETLALIVFSENTCCDFINKCSPAIIPKQRSLLHCKKNALLYFCFKPFLWLHLRHDTWCCCGVPMVNSSPVSLQMSRRDRKFHPRPTNSSAVVSQSAGFSYLCSSFRIYWVSQPHHRAWNYCGGD